MLPGAESAALALNALLFEEFIAREADAGRLKLQLTALPQKKALLHGHCHQKAFDTFDATLALLRTLPGAEVNAIESSCCGMAGAFGHEKGHYDVSMKMGELALFPAVRAAPQATIVAAGVSCRQQIADATGREALHPLVVLARAL